MSFLRKPRRDQRYLEVLRTYAKQISSIHNIKDLLKSLLKTLVEIAQVRNGNILLLENDLKAFVVRESLGGDPLILQFSVRDPFLNFLCQTGKMMTKHRVLESSTLIDIKEAGLAFFTSVCGEVVFPLQVENKTIGILSLGSQPNGEAYASDQLDLLEVLTSMASISIDNALLYDSMAKQNLKLSEIAKLKTQFVSTISHELSTPLNGILGLTQVLLDPETSGPLNDDQRRYIQMTRSAGEELSEIVNQILNLTRFQSDRSLEVKRVNLIKTVDSIQGDLEEVFEQKGILFKKEIGDPLNVYGDEGQIRQVIQSLLENAVKFSRKDISNVVGIQTSKHGDMVKVCIYDQGIGIGDENHEVIFDEFRQADGDMTRSYGGTGLGLALAKKIVELHGGRIWVESKKGEGSQFFFTLPLKPGLVQAPEIESQH